MNILILEDEITSFRQLRKMLEEQNPSYNIIGPMYTVEQTIEYFAARHDTDIIIADVQLNDGLSFSALKYAPPHVPVIFVASDEEYALHAFSYFSLSYLLKPVDGTELSEAMGKAMLLMRLKELKNTPGTLSDILLQYADGQSDDEAEMPRFRERFIVKTTKGEKVLNISMVRYIVSEQKTTYLRLLDDTSYPLNMPLDALSQMLDPNRFMRVNRKFIVPKSQVAGIQPLSHGKERLCLNGSNVPEIIVSRDRRKEVRKWIETPV